MWTLTAQIFIVLAINGVIRNLVDGYNSIVDNVVRTKDILVKIPICPLHGFFKEIVTTEPRLECIVNLTHWIEIHRQGRFLGQKAEIPEQAANRDVIRS